MKTIALFGGSFDPPHIAHELIVKEALKIKEVQKVVVMPTFLNPFKTSSFAPSALRLKWLKSIFKDYKNVEVSSFEVSKEKKNSTIDTVKYLLKEYSKVYLIIGADNLESLVRWQQYDELKTLVSFVVATRDKIKIPESFMQLVIAKDISSTALRKNMNSLSLPTVCSPEIIEFYKEKYEK